MYEIYTVKPNETVEFIADKYDTTEDVIYQINGLANDYNVVSGMQLVVPKRGSSPYTYYTVKKGDRVFM